MLSKFKNKTTDNKAGAINAILILIALYWSKKRVVNPIAPNGTKSRRNSNNFLIKELPYREQSKSTSFESKINHQLHARTKQQSNIFFKISAAMQVLCLLSQ